MARATKRCAVRGCARRHYARGWCQAHYGRWRKHGDAGVTQIGQPRARHGTVGMYTNHRCRCDDCTRAHTEWQYAYRNDQAHPERLEKHLRREREAYRRGQRRAAASGGVTG